MQGVGALNAHIPAVVIDLAGVGARVDLGVVGVQDGLVAEAITNFEIPLFNAHRLIKGLVNGFNIGYKDSAGPLRPLQLQQIRVSEVLHSLHGLFDMRDHNVVTIVEGVIACVVQPASLDTAQLLFCS